MESINMAILNGPTIMGFSFEVFIMFCAGVGNLICAMLVWKPLREERSELLSAFFAFLVYQAVSMFAMALALQTQNIAYANISGLAVLLGSVYMLKFIFSSFSMTARKVIFMTLLVIVLSIFAWFIQTPERGLLLEHFIIWYDIVIIGVIVGGSIIAFGIKTSERWLRFKAIGGGSGVVTCCIVSNMALLGGGILLSSLLHLIAPFIILTSLIIARHRQKIA